jgi:hypothetical protein
MSSIFICHSSADKRFAKRLGTRLSRFGVKVWVDEAEIKVGDSLLEKISKGIAESEYLGIILSSNSVNSAWVQKEVQIATTLEIESRRLKVLPILFKECEVPLFLKEKLYADFRNTRWFDRSVEELLRVLLPADVREVLGNVVRGAADAELESYKALPDIELAQIDKYFTLRGSARARIVHLLHRHQERGWVINNPRNPSTCDVIDTEVKWVKDGRAEVASREYWYLRWFDIHLGKYEYVLNEEIKPTYILVREPDGSWRVETHRYTTSVCYVG